MKIILSRKGFDSSSGGCPSPILPDGRAISIPIPDAGSPTCFADITDYANSKEAINLGQLVEDLTKGRLKSSSGAHIDPDINPQSLPRLPGWQALLGQHGSAQTHLSNQGVSRGDLFLFFGLFRPVERVNNRFQFIPKTVAEHRLWGWLQISEHCQPESLGEVPWLDYHPHWNRPEYSNNHLYFAAQNLTLAGRNTKLPGAGVFADNANPALRLTQEGATKPSLWRLPKGLSPSKMRPPLSYHNDASRWQRKRDYVLLHSVARGQEFVLQADKYPRVEDWLKSLFLI